MRWSDAVRVGSVLIAYLTLGTLYALYTPAWQSPDEPAHYNVVRHIVETGQLPVLGRGDYPHAYLEEIKAARFPPTLSIAPLRYESWQPPLYYLLAAPVYRATDGSLLALRLFSLLLGAGVVSLAYAVASAVQPQQPRLATAVAAFVAFLPMHLAVSASVNNDVPAELLIALVAWRVLRQIGAATTGRRPLILTGLLLGLGLVTKLTVYYTALPLALLGLWWQSRQSRDLIRPAAALLLPALLIVLPWLARNVTLYGWPDLLGTINHAAVVVGQLRTADYIAQAGWPAYLAQFATTTFHSFWGQFGWMAVPLDGRTYLGLLMLSALAVAGLIVRWRSSPRPPVTTPPQHLTPPPPLHVRGEGGQARLLLALWLGLAVAGYLIYNVSFVQFQGRYLFPGLIPIALLAVNGWREALARPRWWLAAGVVAAMTALALVGGAPGRWTLAIGGAMIAALVLRRGLPAAWDAWLWVLPLIGLAALSGYTLFATVVPNL
jgi:4-amino-4-deoxy-L-arabinose transferase-like glycosyltransferase